MTTPLPWGNEFLAGTGTSGQQESRVTALTNGGFVATWTFTGTSGDDVQAQLFNADGSKNGAVFVVNTTTANSQREPDIRALSDGRFLVAWADFGKTGGDTSGDAIRAQVFNADGSKSGAELLVNTTAFDDQVDATVAALDGGRFVVAWADQSVSGGDTSEDAVRAQVFNADGSKSGAEFLVNTTTSDQQYDPSITALHDGRFVVAWTDNSKTGDDTGGFAVRAQVFNADGSKNGGELLVNSSTSGSQLAPSITALDGGRFVAAWSDLSLGAGDASSQAIRAQVFNANGSKSGVEILVNTTTASGQKEPSITALPDGRFVVVWTDESQGAGDTSFEAIRAQVFNADGSRSGDEFLVNTTTANDQNGPSITALADGRFVVTWTDYSVSGLDAPNGAIRAQIFDPRLVGVTLIGSAANDDWVGTSFSDEMQGGAGNDRMLGGAAADSFTGGAGLDEIDGGGGSDTADFSDKSVPVQLTLSGSVLADVFVGGLLEDRLRNIENIIGGAGDDVLTGDVASNEFSGGGGNDLFRGNAGRDSLDGGTGSDTASYEDKSASVQVVLNGSFVADVVVNGVAEDRIRNIENITGGSGDDLFIGDTLSNSFVGGGGVDVALGEGGDDQAQGGEGNDYLYGGDGNDTLNGENGADALFGDAGNDVLLGGAGADYIDGGTGNDYADGGDANDIFLMGADNDTVLGQAGNDYAELADGDDYADGGAGEDILLGGLGNDVLLGGADADYLDAGEGNDYADGGDANDIFLMGAGNDTAVGQAGNDYFDMGDGDDSATGGAGDDIFLGGSGNDVFDAGAGTDVAVGAGGNDSYLVRSTSGLLLVYDFVAGGTDDVLRLTADTGITSFAQAQAKLSFNASVYASVLTIDADTSVWLVGVTNAQLTTADFGFV